MSKCDCGGQAFMVFLILENWKALALPLRVSE